MKVTNNHNLPQQIVDAVTYSDRNFSSDWISVTELISPVLIRQLKKEHQSEITEDVSDRLWALLGTSVHYVLSKNEGDKDFTEERLSMVIDGITITGQSDNYNAETKCIEDWKVTSVFAFLLGDKPEWEQQLNIYAELWEQNGFDVKELKIQAILRDWTKSRTYKDSSYPEIPFKTVSLPVWPKERRIAFIKERIKAHLSDPIECTPDEKWSKPDTWAIMKDGRKTAVRVLETKEKADIYLKLNIKKEIDKHYVVHRPGKNIRCEDYCPVRLFCKYRSNK